MSKKMRNTLRAATMRNFSRYCLDRYIVIDDVTMDKSEQDKFIKQINERLWWAIQETNAMVNGRVLPFVQVRGYVKDNTKLRLIINEFDSHATTKDYEPIEDLDIKDTSHLLVFQTIDPQRRILIGDEFIPGNAKMYINPTDLSAAVVDIFLDIAMFNSISFLRDLSLEEKQKINQIKYGFYKQHKLPSYYLVDKNNPPAYFSFAYSARIDSKNIDYEKYIYYWKKFLEEIFPGQLTKNPLPEEQLLQHIDKENIADIYFQREFWSRLDKGDYLFLRINSLPKKLENQAIISDYFGVNECQVGEVRVVPIHDYFRPFIRRQIQELNISAFKVVV